MRSSWSDHLTSAPHRFLRFAECLCGCFNVAATIVLELTKRSPPHRVLVWRVGWLAISAADHPGVMQPNPESFDRTQRPLLAQSAYYVATGVFPFLSRR